MHFKEKVQFICEKNNWNFDKLHQYVELIEQKNKVMNLTGFTKDKLWEEGILESLVFMDSIVNENAKTILDVGSGVGFPSLPYAIVRNDLNFTIYEPLQKRVNFLNMVIQQLKLKNILVIKDRAENIKEKNLFDIVTARAVGDVATMLMISFHLVKLNGKISLIKGIKYQEELKHAQPILKLLKCSIAVNLLENSYSTKQNYVINIVKLRSTPKQFPFLWKEIVKFKKIDSN